MPTPAHFLIVHDDEDGRFLIRRSLRTYFPDAAIFDAREGEEALAVMARLAFDAVVTDQRMIGMSGTELVRQIRATNSNIPILMTTSDEHLAAQALAAGVTEFYGSKDWSGIGLALKECLNTRLTYPLGRPVISLRPPS